MGTNAKCVRTARIVVAPTVGFTSAAVAASSHRTEHTMTTLTSLAITFDDLEFKPCSPSVSYAPKVQARMTFTNGWGVSVVSHSAPGEHCVYGFVHEDTYELAVFAPNGRIHYVNPVARGDVRTWISSAEVTACMNEVQAFLKKDADFPPKYWVDQWGQ